MKTILPAILSLCVAYPIQAAEAPLPIRFAPLPLEEGKVVYEQFRGLMDYLGESVGRAVHWETHKDYAAIIAAFAAGQIDLAYLGPLPYVILSRTTKAAQPLCCFRDADGEASYTCSLVAFGGDLDATDAGRKPIPALKGLRFGLTQPYSTCGYLAVSEMLTAAGTGLNLDSNRFEYAGSHSKAVLGVVDGRYDVAGVKTAIARRYAHLDLEPIATSRRYPGFTLVANGATLDADTIARLGAALQRLVPGAPGPLATRMAGWGEQVREGTLPLSQCDYGAVAESLARVPWPIPGVTP